MKYFSPPSDAPIIEFEEYSVLPHLDNDDWTNESCCQDLISYLGGSLAEVHQTLLRSGNKGYFPQNSEVVKWRSKVPTLIAIGLNIEEQLVYSSHPPYQTGILYTLHFSSIEEENING